MVRSSSAEGGACLPANSFASVATSVATSSATPLIRWAGGKRALAPRLYAKLPPRLTLDNASVRDASVRYFEPFAGGAALHLYLRGRGVTAPATLSDLNVDLIDAYETVAADPAGVWSTFDLFANGHTAEKYYRMRDAWNGIRDTWTDTRRAAAFLYLTKTSFNGLWRVNASGGFNVPCGYQTTRGERRVLEPMLPLGDLCAFAHAMRNVTFHGCHFVDALMSAREGDVVYCDPPYLALSPTSNFTSYASGSFGFAEHEMLASVARELVKRGVFVMLSNADVPAAHALYPRSEWDLEIVSASRSISARGASRGAVTELVITPKGA